LSGQKPRLSEPPTPGDGLRAVGGAGFRQWAVEKTLFLFALSATTGLALIALFIVHEGLPIIVSKGLDDFLISTDWRPSDGSFGILAMIVGTVAVTAGALVIAVPLGLASAIALTEFCPHGPARLLKALIELLAGIPSVVYGFIGLLVLVPLIRNLLGGPGLSVLASSVVLGVMILPSIVSISMDAIAAVPQSYREGSIALGATKWQTVWRVVLRAARSGIIAAIILGMGRAVGETMAVLMVAGNTVLVPHSVPDPVRTLTSTIALEMGYAAGEHRQALFATGIVLFALIMILNAMAVWASRKRT
jgi:phosphate ABC transporter permease protein PstC